MKRTAAALIACAALGACATPTLYGPANGPNASGFFETRIESDRFRVSYRGGNGAPAAQVDDYALLRAAELTVASGYDWFEVAARCRDGVAPCGPQLTATLEIKLGRGPRPAQLNVYCASGVIAAIGARVPPGPPLP